MSSITNNCNNNNNTSSTSSAVSAAGELFSQASRLSMNGNSVANMAADTFMQQAAAYRFMSNPAAVLQVKKIGDNMSAKIFADNPKN